MSLGTKWYSAIAVAAVLLLMASCGEGPTLPSDSGESGPIMKRGGGGGGGPPQLRDVDVKIRSDFAGNALIGDGWDDGIYYGGKCGVVAKAGSSFSFFPFYGAMNKKEWKDYQADSDCWVGGDSTNVIQRRIWVDLANAKVHDESLHDLGTEQTVQDMIDDGSLPGIDIGSNVMNHAKVSTFDVTGPSSGSFGVPYCNYLQFDDDVGANDLLISQGGGSTHVETQPGLDNNVGLCAYDTSGEEPLWVLLHLDIAYDVLDK